MRMPRPTTLALALAACWAAPGAANPLDPLVVAGQAAFAQQGKLFTITTGERAIIDWRAFSIAADETTRFAQASASAAVLNRVSGDATSALLGQLLSNGRVYLINPNGILIGNGARIDTGGFIASTLALSDADFLSGRLRFTDGDQAGAVINHGAIQGNGSLVALVGTQVENHGRVESAGGQVVAAAARGVELLDAYSPQIRVVLDGASDAQLHRVLNRGVLSAAVPAGSGAVSDAVGARIEGGRVVLHAAGDTLLEGAAVVSADNAAGKGGTVQVLGARVGLFNATKVSAGGATGGGNILIGGDQGGGNPEVRNAALTYLAPGVTLDASATLAGDGGRVIVWADDTARVYGTVAARGAMGGDGAGGFVETSGKRFLDVAGIRVDAAGATPGTWLLDPLDITVVAGAGTVNNGGAPAFTPGGGSSQVGADLITGQLDAGTSVTLNTGVAGADAGNITIDAPIVKAADNAASLTLIADNNIVVNQDIKLSNNPMTGTNSGVNAGFTATAGGDFSIANATIEAYNISVNAASISRSGTQSNDFVFGFIFPSAGTLNLTTQSGAIGSLANPIRFANPDGAGRTWTMNTVNAGAAGHIFLQPTRDDYGTFGGTVIQTDPATTQTVYLNHTGTGTFNLFGDITGNDDWILNSAGSFSAGNFGGSFGGPVGKLTANSITATVAGNFGGSQFGAPGLIFDTSAANGNITMTGGTFHGTGCGGDNVGFGIAPGTGTVTATSTGGGCGGSIQLAHFGGDLLTSRYVLKFTGGGAGNYMRLKAVDGHLIVDSTAGFDASLNDKETLLQTLAAGKDIIFQGGTVQGGRVDILATGNIDNLAVGTSGFVQTNAFGGPYWKLYATGGGIGLTNPVEGVAEWVGELVSGGAGALGDINVKFNSGGTPGIATIATHAGSAQNIRITAAGSLGFSPGQPGFGGEFSTANDAYTMNVGGSMFFTMFNDTATAASFDLTVAGSAVTNTCCGTVGRWMSTTGPLSITSTGGSIGTASQYAYLPASGGITLSALNDIHVDAGANPLTLDNISTGAGAGTIGLRTTAANDLILGGTTSINDALVLDIGGDIVFPAAANFTTSGGLTLNSPTRIAATASVAITGGAFGGSGSLDNAGTLTKAGAGTGTLNGLVTNSGAMNIDGGSLSLAGGYADGGGTLALGGGTVSGPAGGLALSSGTLAGSGSWNGDVNNTGGTVSPGASPGRLIINGAYTQGAAGTLDIEITGTAAGSEYDQLTVNGTATLDGSVAVTTPGTFIPATSDVFDFLTASSVMGSFATTDLPSGYAGGIAYTATGASLGFTTVPTPPPPPTTPDTPSATAARVAAVGMFDALARVAPESTSVKFEYVADAEKKPNVLSGNMYGGLDLILPRITFTQSIADMLGVAAASDTPFTPDPNTRIGSGARPPGSGLNSGDSGGADSPQEWRGSTKREAPKTLTDRAREYKNQQENEGMIVRREQDSQRDFSRSLGSGVFDDMNREAAAAHTGARDLALAEGKTEEEANAIGERARRDAISGKVADLGVDQLIVNGTIDADSATGVKPETMLKFAFELEKVAQLAGLKGAKAVLRNLTEEEQQKLKDELNKNPDQASDAVNDATGKAFKEEYGLTVDELLQRMRAEADGAGNIPGSGPDSPPGSPGNTGGGNGIPGGSANQPGGGKGKDVGKGTTTGKGTSGSNTTPGGGAQGGGGPRGTGGNPTNDIGNGRPGGENNTQPSDARPGTGGGAPNSAPNGVGGGGINPGNNNSGGGYTVVVNNVTTSTEDGSTRLDVTVNSPDGTSEQRVIFVERDGSSNVETPSGDLVATYPPGTNNVDGVQPGTTYNSEGGSDVVLTDANRNDGTTPSGGGQTTPAEGSGGENNGNGTTTNANGGDGSNNGSNNGSGEGSGDGSNGNGNSSGNGNSDGGGNTECKGGEDCAEKSGEEAPAEEPPAEDTPKEEGRPNPMANDPVNTAMEIYLDYTLGQGQGTRQQVRAIEIATGGGVTNPGDAPDATGAGNGQSTSFNLDMKNIGVRGGGGVDGTQGPREPPAMSPLDTKSIALKSGGAVTDPPREGGDGGTTNPAIQGMAGAPPVGPAPQLRQGGDGLTSGAAAAVIETSSQLRSSGTR